MSGIDIAIVVLFLAGTLGVGLIRRRPPTEAPGAGQYLLAGRRLTLPAFVVTTVSTFYGGILGVGEYAYGHGLSNWLVFGVPYYLYAGIFAFFLAGRAQACRALTLPDRIREVHGPGPGLLAAGVVLVASLPAAYVLELGILARHVFGGPIEASLCGMAVFSLAYVWRGGFGAVVRTEFLQFGLMFAGFATILGILVATSGGLGFLTDRVPEAHWTWNGGLPVQSIVVWYFIASSTLVEPTFYQHCFAAASPSVARRGLALSILCWFCFDVMTTFTGLYARAILDLGSAPATEAFPSLAMGVLPPGLIGVFFVALFATVLSTVSGYLFVAASTFGRDLLGRTARYRNRVPEATRIGLVLAGGATLAIALVSTSVVRLWHHLGTISTATLLFPVVAAFRPRWRLPPRTTLAQMATALAVTSASLASRALTDDGGYAMGVEPIYAGLSTGVAFYAWHYALRAAGRRSGDKGKGGSGR